MAEKGPQGKLIPPILALLQDKEKNNNSIENHTETGRNRCQTK